MQQTQNLARSISEIFDAHLALIGTNVPAWADLLAEDAMGVYRAAFVTIEQTTPLAEIGHQVTVPVVALGGEKSLGSKVGEMVKAVAKNVEDYVIPNCGHFVPEERPEEIRNRPPHRNNEGQIKPKHLKEVI
jgi:pimeloyl-ACP methyl ester carboxylesterase